MTSPVNNSKKGTDNHQQAPGLIPDEEQLQPTQQPAAAINNANDITQEEVVVIKAWLAAEYEKLHEDLRRQYERFDEDRRQFREKLRKQDEKFAEDLRKQDERFAEDLRKQDERFEKDIQSVRDSLEDLQKQVDASKKEFGPDKEQFYSANEEKNERSEKSQPEEQVKILPVEKPQTEEQPKVFLPEVNTSGDKFSFKRCIEKIWSYIHKFFNWFLRLSSSPNNNQAPWMMSGVRVNNLPSSAVVLSSSSVVSKSLVTDEKQELDKDFISYSL